MKTSNKKQKTNKKKRKTTNKKKQKTTNKQKETKSEQHIRFKAESEMMIKKQKKAATITKHKLKKSCRWTEDDIIELQCINCQEYKPRTTEYFRVANGGRTLKYAKAGYESLCNNTENPCRTCSKLKGKLERETNEDLYFIRLAKKYSELPLAKLNKKRWEQQPIRGLWSNQELKCVSNAKDWQLNICRRDNNKDHNIDNIFFEAAELNPQQSGDTIPCLETVYTEFVRDVFRGPPTATIEQSVEGYARNLTQNIKITQARFIQNARNNRKQNGVTINPKKSKAYAKQCYQLHLKKIIEVMVTNNIKNDIMTGRLSTPLTYKAKKCLIQYKQTARELVMAALIKNPVCDVSAIPLTIKNGARRFSCDRNDDDKSHFGPIDQEPTLNNINFRCRVFNTQKKMTREKFLQFLLSQILLPLTGVQQKLAQSEFNTLKNTKYKS